MWKTGKKHMWREKSVVEDLAVTLSVASSSLEVVLWETFWLSYAVCVEAMEKNPHFLIKGGEKCSGRLSKM